MQQAILYQYPIIPAYRLNLDYSRRFPSSKIRANTVGFGWIHSSFPGRFPAFLGGGALKGETDA